MNYPRFTLISITLCSIACFSMEIGIPNVLRLPQDIVGYIFIVSESESIRYRLKAKNQYAIPFTIAPLFTKHCTTDTPLNESVMNPLPGTPVLTNIQY
jgi:hypothetical protein